MARSVTRARALPAPHPPPGSSGRSRKSESASPPFCPPHDGKDAQPIETRLLVFAWQLQRCCVAIRSIFAKAISDFLTRMFYEDDRLAFVTRYFIAYASLLDG